MVVVALLCVALPAAANAGTVELTTDRILYRAAPGERNIVVFRYLTRGAELSDPAGVTPGAGCTLIGSNTAQCLADRDLPEGAELHLGDRNDVARLGAAGGGARLFGGAGDDRLEGGPGYNELIGGPGSDVMIGNVYTNIFDQGARRDGADTMTVVGASTTRASAWVDYGRRRRSVQASLDGRRNDGEAGERDLIGPFITAVQGGRGDDRLTGDAAGNDLIGGPGADVLAGRGDDDALIATTTGPKRFLPGKRVRGRGEDRLFGGAGQDLLEGSESRNLLDGGPGSDEIWTIRGPDRVRAVDGVVDEIRCANAGERLREDRIDLDRTCTSPAFHKKPPIPFSADGMINSSHDSTEYYAAVAVGCPGLITVPCRGTAQVRLDGQVIGQGAFDVSWGSSDTAVVALPTTREIVELMQNRSPRMSVTILSPRHGPLSIGLPKTGTGWLFGLPHIPRLD